MIITGSEDPKRVGSFTASNISRLLSEGTGKTSQTYTLELALQSIGIKNDIETPAMRHGKENQFNGFHFCIKPRYPFSEWFDEYIPINDYCGASPDFKIDSITPGDIKCPASIFEYLIQTKRIPKKYYLQVQMQMIATKASVGLLCFYLTKPEEWGKDTWEEYPIPLEDRFKILEIQKDEEAQEKILVSVEKYQFHKLRLIELLKEAKKVNEVDFFYNQLYSNRYEKLQNASNIFVAAERGLIRVNDEFYYGKK